MIGEGLQLMVFISSVLPYAWIMAWRWLKIRVETSCYV